MFGSLGRRAAESVVGLFALLGFAFVPLGSKTGLEHTLALLATPAVREAGSGLVAAVGRAKVLIVGMLTADEPSTAPLPVPSGRGRDAKVRPGAPAFPNR